jgi:hypothetical protein
VNAQEEINRRLFGRHRSRQFQFPLLWLVLFLGIAPAAIWVGHLTAPLILGATRAFVPSHLTSSPNLDGDLITDSIGAIVLLTLLAGVSAFVLMRVYGDDGVVVVTVVSAALTVGCIALLLLLVTGSGLVSPINAHGDDLFVIYGLPASLATAIGAAIGSAVSIRR